MPIGCVCAKGPAASGFAPGEHGTTFGGNPLACAAGFALLSAVIEGKIPEKAAVVGEYLKAGLEKRAEVLGIRQVRAAGLMVGAEFEAPVAAMVKQVLFEKQHYLVGCVGSLYA